MYQLKRITDSINPLINHFRFTDATSDHQGVGSDQDEEVAKEKSISEYYETIIAKKYDFPFTTGIAVHPNKKQSIIKSQWEILERHYFFLSWFKGEHPRWIEEIKLNEEYRVYMGLIAVNNNLCVTSAVLRSQSNKIAFMNLLAAEENYNICCKKLVNDAHRMATLIERSNLCELTTKQAFTKPIDHAIHYLNPSKENLIFIDKYLCISSEPLNILNHKFNTKTSKHDFYGTRYASASTSDELISFFLGKPGPSINEIIGNIPNSRLIHPIG